MAWFISEVELPLLNSNLVHGVAVLLAEIHPMVVQGKLVSFFVGAQLA